MYQFSVVTNIPETPANFFKTLKLYYLTKQNLSIFEWRGATLELAGERDES